VIIPYSRFSLYGNRGVTGVFDLEISSTTLKAVFSLYRGFFGEAKNNPQIHYIIANIP
jgi:hypothetical protein